MKKVYNTQNRSKKGPDQWKDIPCSRTGKFNIVNMLILPSLIYVFNEILIKILATY